MSAPFVGIDLGGTNMQVGVVRADARETGAETAILGSARKKTKAADGLEEVVDRICDAVLEACREAGITAGDLAGIGIGAPGAIDPNAGLVLEAVNLRWNDVPLASMLEDRLGRPVAVDNDVNVAIYGEWALGAARGTSDVLGVWVGTGIGGGLMLGGKLFYGYHFTAGEIGHMLAFPRNPPGHRSLEHNCSRTSVVDRIVRLIAANRKSMLTEITQGRYEKIKSRALAEAYNAGDELTCEVVNDAAALLGDTIGSVVTLLSLQRVVIGGGLTEAIGEPFVSRVREQTQAVAFPEVCREVEVVSSTLLDDAGLLGAAMIAADRIEAPLPS